MKIYPTRDRDNIQDIYCNEACPLRMFVVILIAIIIIVSYFIKYNQLWKNIYFSLKDAYY